MSPRWIRITSRLAFFLCGATSLLTAAPFVLLRGAEMPYEREWIIFVAVLGIVGLFSVTLTMLPRSWIAKPLNKDRDDKQVFLAPLKWLGSLAAVAYIAALFVFLAPPRWNLDPQLMYFMSPLYFVKMQIDPSLLTVFCLLAPMNAAVYGALGLTLGYAWLAARKRKAT
jgi:hypothetical protein